jgi:glycine/D-amino acid oxidase-like deaminating enzyme
MQSQPAGRGRDSLRRSLWTSQSSATETYAPLAASIHADVIVIGAGLAGASTAFHLAAAGADVVLLEAETPGFGATGNSGGLIAPNFVGLTPERAEQQFGPEAGRRLTRLVGKSAQRLFDLIAELGIDCDARQDGFWTPAHTPEMATEQRQHAGEWRAQGYDVTFVDQAETQAALGSHRYFGAMRFGEGGQLDPLALVQGLVRRAVERGARVFASTPVQRLQRRGDLWEATTAQGRVQAPRVVLAANGGNAGLHPLMRHTTLPLHVIEFATAPLTSEQRGAALPEGGAFTDRQSYLFTARHDAEGRLISAFPMSAPLQGLRAYEREAQLRLKRHFPGLGPVTIEHIWRGTAFLNTTFLPHVFDLKDGAYAIQACNGRGIPINVALGQEMAEALATGTFENLSLPLQTPRPVRFHALARFAPYVAMSVAYLHARLLKRIPVGTDAV